MKESYTTMKKNVDQIDDNLLLLSIAQFLEKKNLTFTLSIFLSETRLKKDTKLYLAKSDDSITYNKLWNGNLENALRGKGESLLNQWKSSPQDTFLDMCLINQIKHNKKNENIHHEKSIQKAPVGHGNIDVTKIHQITLSQALKDSEVLRVDIEKTLFQRESKLQSQAEEIRSFARQKEMMNQTIQSLKLQLANLQNKYSLQNDEVKKSVAKATEMHKSLQMAQMKMLKVSEREATLKLREQQNQREKVELLLMRKDAAKTIDKTRSILYRRMEKWKNNKFTLKERISMLVGDVQNAKLREVELMKDREQFKSQLSAMKIYVKELCYLLNYSRKHFGILPSSYSSKVELALLDSFLGGTIMYPQDNYTKKLDNDEKKNNRNIMPQEVQRNCSSPYDKKYKYQIEKSIMRHNFEQDSVSTLKHQVVSNRPETKRRIEENQKELMEDAKRKEKMEEEARIQEEQEKERRRIEEKQKELMEEAERKEKMEEEARIQEEQEKERRRIEEKQKELMEEAKRKEKMEEEARIQEEQEKERRRIEEKQKELMEEAKRKEKMEEEARIQEKNEKVDEDSHSHDSSSSEENMQNSISSFEMSGEFSDVEFDDDEVSGNDTASW